VRQVEHAPNPLFHRVERRPELGPIRVLFVGSLCPLKGTDLLLQALDRLQPELDFRLTLVGNASADFLARLKQSTSATLWQRVSMRSQLSQAEVAEELARATLMLFPTRVDNSPNSVKEAVVAAVPVVGSAVGGILDYVRPGSNGLTFPAKNLEAFIEAIRTAAAHPLFGQGKVEPGTLAQMREYLSSREMAQRFLAAYQRVANPAAN
jgi:glycosyltransferase involved in cell wall biosynthesis